LNPAKWIWLPAQRTLPNTSVLFRKEFDISSEVNSARGWICADSRYCLYINGNRVQWGPPPADPREISVDPFDVKKLLVKGKNKKTTC